MKTLINTLKEEKLLAIIGLFALSIAFSLSLLEARMWYANTTQYSFLRWNLFLAFIPFAISTFLLLAKHFVPSFIFISFAAVWLLFFPNAPYILTDLFHLRAKHGVPLWFDLALILSFAWNGLLLGFVSLADMQKEVRRRFGRFSAWFFVLSSLFLSGFGIYLGRYLRWNSWDILANPTALALDILDRLINPLAHPATWGVTIVFSVFLTLCYLMIKQLGERSSLQS